MSGQAGEGELPSWRHALLVVRRRAAARPALTISAVLAVAGVCAWWVVGPSGTDWTAQQARADFAAHHPWTPVDLSWYGGVQAASYSVLTPPLAALVGLRLLSALAAVSAAVCLGDLLSISRVRRPLLAAAWAAVACVANVVSGRTAFAVGIAFSAAALCTAARRTVAKPGPLAVLAAVLAALSSPLAGVFLALVCAGWAISARARPLLAVAAAAPVAVIALVLGEGGQMPISWAGIWKPLAVTVVIAVVCRSPALRMTGWLLVIATLAALLIPSPVGTNVVRLVALFGGAALLADSVLPRWVLGAVIAVCGYWFGVGPAVEFGNAGQPTREVASARELVADLRGVGTLQGRVEVVPLHTHGESAVVSPLARGWFRQLDVRDAAALYSPGLDAATYRRWLSTNAVEYVALSPLPLDWSASREVRLLGTAPPYLELVFQSRAWTVWRVRDFTPIAPSVVAMDAAHVTFQAPAGVSEVRVRWSRWLRADHGCVSRKGVFTQLRLTSAATVTVSSSYSAPFDGSHCG